MHEFPEEYTNSGLGGAQSGARDVTSTISNPDLAQLINVWSSLPATIRRGIMAMVQEMTRE